MQPDNELWNKTFSASTNWNVITASLLRDEFWQQVKDVSGPTCFLLQEGTYFFPDTPLDAPAPLVFKGMGGPAPPAPLTENNSTSSSTSSPPSKSVIIRNGNKAAPVITIDGREGCVFEGISFVSDSINGCIVVRDGPAKFIDCQFRMNSKASMCAVVQVKYHCALLQCDFDSGPIGVQVNEPESHFDVPKPTVESNVNSSGSRRSSSVSGSRSITKSSSNSRLTPTPTKKSTDDAASSLDLTVNVKIEDCGFTGSMLRDGIGAYGMCKMYCSHVSVEGVTGTGMVFGGTSGGFIKDSVVALCGRNGIVAECLTTIWLRQCSVERCGGVGVQVCGMAKPSIMGCTIEGNAYLLDGAAAPSGGANTSVVEEASSSPPSTLQKYPAPQILVSGASAPRFTQNEINGVPVAANDIGPSPTSTTLVVITDAADGSFDNNTVHASKGDRGVVLDGNTTVSFKGNIITMDVSSLLEAYEDAGKNMDTILDGVVKDSSYANITTNPGIGGGSSSHLRTAVRGNAPQEYFAVTLGPWQQAKLQGGNRFRYNDISGQRNTINRDGELLLQDAPSNALYVVVDQLPSWAPFDWTPLSQIPEGFVEKAMSESTMNQVLHPRRPHSSSTRQSLNDSTLQASGVTSPKEPRRPESRSSGRVGQRPGTASHPAAPSLPSPRKPTTAKSSSTTKGGEASAPLTHQKRTASTTPRSKGPSRDEDTTRPSSSRSSHSNNNKDYNKEIGQLKTTIATLKARLRSGGGSRPTSAQQRVWNQHSTPNANKSAAGDTADGGGDSPRVFAEEVRVGRYVWDKTKLKDFNRLLVPLSECRREAESGDRQGYWKDIPNRLHDQWLHDKQTAKQVADKQREEEVTNRPKLTQQQQEEMAIRMHDESMRQHHETKIRVREAVIHMEKESRFSKVLNSSRHQSRPRDKFGEPAPLSTEELREFNERIYYEQKEKKEELMKVLHARYDRPPSPPYLSRGGRAKKKATALELETYCNSLYKGHRDADAAAKAAEVLGRPIYVREGKSRSELYPPLIANPKVYPRAEIEAYCASLYKSHADGYPDLPSPSSITPRPASAQRSSYKSPSRPAAAAAASSSRDTSPRAATSMAQAVPPPGFSNSRDTNPTHTPAPPTFN